MIPSTPCSLYCDVAYHNVSAVAAPDAGTGITTSHSSSINIAPCGCQLIISTIHAFDGKCGTSVNMNGCSGAGCDAIPRTGNFYRGAAALDVDADARGIDSRAVQREVDAACVYANVSTAFTDGAQFGFGAEIGISTQKLHARGPMALPELTTYKYLIEGEGQIRPK